jgi:hypothetical protein
LPNGLVSKWLESKRHHSWRDKMPLQTNEGGSPCNIS